MDDKSANAERTPWLPSWDGPLYAANTAHHRVYDAGFVESLPLTDARRILDLGCGAGDFTRCIADLVPTGEVVGLDPQPSLLAEAQRVAAKNQSFVCGAAQNLRALFPDDGGFDVVMSRAAMHWIPMTDHPSLLAEIVRVLRPGGWFRLEMGGAGNIPRVQPILDACSVALGGPSAPWTFPDAGTYLELLESAGFVLDQGHVRTVAQRRVFDATTLRSWLESQVYQAYEYALPGALHAAFRASVEARIDDMRRSDGSLDQTYVRLDARVRKP
jgi:ubiquinone/menaquinone biosynthesis C-methylase UbiE